MQNTNTRTNNAHPTLHLAPAVSILCLVALAGTSFAQPLMRFRGAPGDIVGTPDGFASRVGGGETLQEVGFGNQGTGPGYLSETGGGGGTSGGLVSQAFGQVGYCELLLEGDITEAAIPGGRTFVEFFGRARANFNPANFNGSIGASVLWDTGRYTIDSDVPVLYRITSSGEFAGLNGKRGFFRPGLHDLPLAGNNSRTGGIRAGNGTNQLLQDAWEARATFELRKPGTLALYADGMRRGEPTLSATFFGSTIDFVDPPVVDTRGFLTCSARITGGGAPANTRIAIVTDSVESFAVGNVAEGGFSSVFRALSKNGHSALRFAGAAGAGATLTRIELGVWGSTAPTAVEAPTRTVLRSLTTGNAAPGLGAGVLVGLLSPPCVSDAGEAACFSTITGTGVTTSNDRVLWSITSASAVALARTGVTLTGLPTGVRIASFLTSDLSPRLSLSKNGSAVFLATLTGTGVTTANDQALLRASRSGGVQIVLREGQSIAGLPASSVLASFGDPFVNDTGVISVFATVSGAGISTANDVVLIKNGAVVLAENLQAPGLPAGVLLAFDGPSILPNATSGDPTQLTPTINSDDEQFFYANLRGAGVNSANEVCFLAGKPGAWRVLARLGDAAPAGGTIVLPIGFTSINARGQCVFRTGVQTAPGATTRALFFHDPAGGLQEVARANQVLTIGSGEALQLQGVDMAFASSGEDGRGCALSDAGMLAFRAGLATGGDGAFAFFPAVPVCNDLDFNNDGVTPDIIDIVHFFSVFAGGNCPTASCDPIDFNNDGVFPDTNDLIKFIDVFGGGNC